MTGEGCWRRVVAGSGERFLHFGRNDEEGGRIQGLLQGPRHNRPVIPSAGRSQSRGISRWITPVTLSNRAFKALFTWLTAWRRVPVLSPSGTSASEPRVPSGRFSPGSWRSTYLNAALAREEGGGFGQPRRIPPLVVVPGGHGEQRAVHDLRQGEIDDRRM